MKGYWIVRTSDVVDSQAQAEYGKAWKPISERYGARIIAGPAPVSSVEGKPIGGCLRKAKGRNCFHCQRVCRPSGMTRIPHRGSENV